MSSLEFLALAMASWALAAAALQLYGGLAGRASLGHALFLLLGAYAGAWLRPSVGLGMLGALAFGAIAGAALSLLGQHMRRAEFALLTLAVGLGFEHVALRWAPLGGRPGLAQTAVQLPLGVWLLGAGAGVVFIALLAGTAWGDRLHLARETPKRARRYGLRPQRDQTIALMVGGAFAALAGWIAMSQSARVGGASFSFIDSLEFYALLRLGKPRGVLSAALRASAWIGLEHVCRPWPGLGPLLLTVVALGYLASQNVRRAEAL